MHILVAPNAFKNSLSAPEVAEMIRKGLMQSKLKCTIECFPVADGGDGTAALITDKLGGFQEETLVTNPFGKLIKATFGVVHSGRTAVIEMANASGIRLLDPKSLNPLRATSFGTGQQIGSALKNGIKNIIITMGGSATVDGGTGILKALGARFLDDKGKVLPTSLESYTSLSSIDLTGLDERASNCRFTVLCDVENMLLGKQGAANIFGPQKGASPDKVRILNAALTRLTEVVFKQTSKNIAKIKYGGTAGGAAAGLYAILDAELVNGIEYFLNATDFDAALQRSNLVITAEGSIDEQTLKGKGPYGVAFRAKKKGIPVIGLAGKVPLNQNSGLQQYFDVLMAIGNRPSDMPTALSDTSINIIRTGRQIGNLLAMKT
ncbi:MAG TPA: glycerate kinase [Hanamia sp.]